MEFNLSRGKGKLPARYKIRDFYRYYRQQYKLKQEKAKFLGKAPQYVVDYKLYCKIIRDFNKMLSEEIINNSAVYKIPAGLGYFRIEKKKMPVAILSSTKNLKVDWAQSMKHKKLIYHLNDHTDGHRFRWHWNKYKVRIPNKTAYSFIPTRGNKRALAHILKTNKSIDYHMAFKRDYTQGHVNYKVHIK